MKEKFLLLRSTYRKWISKLEEKKVFRNIDITYQVVWNLLLIFIIVGMMSIFFVGAAGAGFFASLVQNEPLRPYEEMKQDIYNYEELSEIYFADNVFLGELPYELERREVKLEDVSEYLIQAVVATEDEYFFEHEGIVPKAIVRATFQELANSSVQTGGSTLTQQLVKNQILTNEVSFDRKAREILLAMRIEKFFEKEEILEAYLNVVPFGRNANGANIAGIQAAAQGIFGVDAKDLTIPQAAFIAGLPQSPFGYTPFHGRMEGGKVKDDISAGINRMRTVLRRMKESGYISEEEYQLALDYDIKANLTTPSVSTYEAYPHLTAEVLQRATDVLALQMLEQDGYNEEKLSELDDEERASIRTRYRGLADRDLRRNGYRIHTTIDKEMYDRMQESIANNSHIFARDKQGEIEEVGAVLINNKTGAILSFVPGRDFHKQELNHATQAFRSNGSTMKPLLAYGPAMDIGAVQPGYIIPDIPTNYKNGGKPVTNFTSSSYKGLITVREALKSSQNTTAVRSFWRTPHDKSRDTLMKMGITNLIPGEPFESAALGALRNGISVEENTSAYTTFANGGKHIPSYMIERIETKDGETIFEHQITTTDVFSPQTAYLMIDMMRDVINGGTASYLRGKLKFQSDFAGKTGTSQNIWDAWFVGTNPNVTMGVWLGYDTPKPLERHRNLSYSQRTQQIWANLMNVAYDVNPELIAPPNRFERPNGIVERSICGISGLLPSDLCREAGLVKTDLFNANFVPTKVDDSLLKVNYVLIDGEAYIALDNTPLEFTFEGIRIKEEVLENMPDTVNLPDEWEKIVPDRTAIDNNKVPNAVTNTSLSGKNLTWAKHTENDIIGYRIYRAESGTNNYLLIGHVKENTTVNYEVTGKGFAYYVTAVDTRGRESAPSPITIGEGWISEEEKRQKEEEERKKEEQRLEEERKKEEQQQKEEEERKKEEEKKKEEERKKEEKKKEEKNERSS